MKYNLNRRPYPGVEERRAMLLAATTRKQRAVMYAPPPIDYDSLRAMLRANVSPLVVNEIAMAWKVGIYELQSVPILAVKKATRGLAGGKVERPSDWRQPIT